MSSDIIYDETIIPLGFFNGIDEISKSKKNNQLSNINNDF
uniref:Uncharacterized protein n=1 Tax=viral metagenome TaxID=1070528 RepID=A0A6C0KNT3_9ZZZZ